MIVPQITSRVTSGRDGQQRGLFPVVPHLLRIAIVVLGTLASAVPIAHAASAREDSARLVFEKTGGVRNSWVYIIKKGDSIDAIFRKQLGTEPVPYALIRELNPGIRNLNRIYPGQKINLPVRQMEDPPNSAPVTVRPNDPVVPTYRVQEGDSLSRIILTELTVTPEMVLPTYRLIRTMNPEIADMNNLPAGSLLKLPPDLVRPDRGLVVPPQTAARQDEKTPPERPAMMPPVSDGVLGLLRSIVTRMGGTLMTMGNYFIPLKETGQITLDCSLIPIVELNDGSTILLDYGNRLSEDIRGLVRSSWNNYSFVPADELRSILTTLGGIIRRSRDYTLAKADQHLTVTPKPEITVFPDWIISSKKSLGGTPYRQGLFLLAEGESALPAAARAFLAKNGLLWTEIDREREVPPPQPPPVEPKGVLDLKQLRGIVLAEKLLAALGEMPERGAVVVIFDQARHGFNLSIVADLLVKKGERRFIIHTKRLPEQFLRILKEEGTDVIQIAENDSGRSLIEGVLKGLSIPVSFGYYSFGIPENGSRQRLSVSFPALRVMVGNGSLYLIDYDLPPDALSLLQDRLAGGFARY